MRSRTASSIFDGTKGFKLVPRQEGHDAFGGLVGSTVAAALAIIAYVAGFSYYVWAFLLARQNPVRRDLLGIPTEGCLILATSPFLSLMSLLASSLLLGAYAQDVRSAQSLFGLIFIPILVPASLLMYADISLLPLGLRIVLYAISFSCPLITARVVLLGDYFVSLLGFFTTPLSRPWSS
jgi:ABC-type Na+ efflux pump permease subunit